MSTPTSAAKHPKLRQHPSTSIVEDPHTTHNCNTLSAPISHHSQEHPRHQDTSSEDSTPKQSKRHPKPKASDFDAEIQSTILLACQYYHKMLCTEHTFPSELEQEHYAHQAWLLACQDYEVEYIATCENYKVIQACDSQICGELKCNVWPLAVSHHGFEASDIDAEKRKTQALVALLKDKNRLVYKDHDAHTGLFENPVLLKAIKNKWFHKAHSEGIIFHLYYNLIPLPTMALVFTVIENCVDEWSSGLFQAIDFTEKAYCELYDEHLASLDKWQAHALGHSILAHLQQCLHEKARIHSKAGSLKETHHSQITDEDLDVAAQQATMEEDEYRPDMAMATGLGDNREQCNKSSWARAV
ncbi:hypothetical protein K439DRAFT_1613278 [Ramaria rubella]|nr:hypothetical protein K439DRAFT_1613278 [Ramaria rubella]